MALVRVGGLKRWVPQIWQGNTNTRIHIFSATGGGRPGSGPLDKPRHKVILPTELAWPYRSSAAGSRARSHRQTSTCTPPRTEQEQKNTVAAAQRAEKWGPLFISPPQCVVWLLLRRIQPARCAQEHLTRAVRMMRCPGPGPDSFPEPC